MTWLLHLGLLLLASSAAYWMLTGIESTPFVLAACLLIVLGWVHQLAHGLQDGA